jgi:hypothetical protein
VLSFLDHRFDSAVLAVVEQRPSVQSEFLKLPRQSVQRAPRVGDDMRAAGSKMARQQPSILARSLEKIYNRIMI